MDSLCSMVAKKKAKGKETEKTSRGYSRLPLQGKTGISGPDREAGAIKGPESVISQKLVAVNYAELPFGQPQLQLQDVRGSTRNPSRRVLRKEPKPSSKQQNEVHRIKRETHNHATPFYQLPFELRQIIYGYCIGHFDTISLRKFLKDGGAPAELPAGMHNMKIKNLYNPAVVRLELAKIIRLFGISRLIGSELRSFFFRMPLFEVVPSTGRLGDLYPALPLQSRAVLELVPRGSLPMFELLIYDPRYCLHGAQRYTQAAFNVLVKLETLDLSAIVEYYVDRWSTLPLLTLAGVCTTCKLKYEQDVARLQSGKKWERFRKMWLDKCKAGDVGWKDVLKVVKFVILGMNDSKASWDPLRRSEKCVWKLQLAGMLPIKGRIRHCRSPPVKSTGST